MDFSFSFNLESFPRFFCFTSEMVAEIRWISVETKDLWFEPRGASWPKARVLRRNTVKWTYCEFDPSKRWRIIEVARKRVDPSKDSYEIVRKCKRIDVFRGNQFSVSYNYSEVTFSSAHTVLNCKIMKYTTKSYFSLRYNLWDVIWTVEMIRIVTFGCCLRAVPKNECFVNVRRQILTVIKINRFWWILTLFESYHCEWSNANIIRLAHQFEYQIYIFEFKTISKSRFLI